MNYWERLCISFHYNGCFFREKIFVGWISAPRVSEAGPRANASIHKLRRGCASSGTPPSKFSGADSGFRRTQCIHPRRAKRRAQVCGDSTVQNDGRRAGSPHPPQAVPLPLRGEGLNAPESGLDFTYRARHFPIAASEALPHCPAGRSPSPGGVGWRGLPLRTDSRRGQRLPTDIRPTPAPREAPGSGLR